MRFLKLSREAATRRAEVVGMDDSSESRGGGLIVLVLIAAAIAGGWFLWQRLGASEAIDETVDVFVPDREEFERRTSHIDEARRLRDVINARQTQNIEELD